MIGQCVSCLTAAACPGTDTECQVRTCVSGTCGVSFTATGTPVTSQPMSGDCKRVQCNGSGMAVVVNDDSDKPVDGNPCTSDVCTNGTRSNPPGRSITARIRPVEGWSTTMSTGLEVAADETACEAAS